MYKTKTKLIKRGLWVTACVLVACCTLGAMAFTPDKEDAEQTRTANTTEMEYCSYHILPQISAPITEAPAPIIIEEPVESVEPEIDPNPYAELVVTDAEKALLACMAYSEAGNQSFEGQVAVVQVALNRYMHEAYSGSISDILLSPYQFAVGSYYEPEQMEAVEAALAGEPALDLNTDVVYFSTGSLTYGSYYKTIGDHVFRTYT